MKTGIDQLKYPNVATTAAKFLVTTRAFDGLLHIIQRSEISLMNNAPMYRRNN